VMVCLSPMMKAGELNYQLKDSGARAVIAHESAVPVVAEAARQTEAHLTISTSELDFLGDNPIPEPHLTSSPRAPWAGRWGATHDLLDLVHRYAGKWTGGPAIQPDDVAMMVYTSGTTGRRGRRHRHRGAAVLGHGHQQTVDRRWRRPLRRAAPGSRRNGRRASQAGTPAKGRRLLSNRNSRWIVAAALMFAVIGLAAGWGTSPSAAPATSPSAPATSSSNARSGPAAGGAAGTVGSVSTSSFTMSTAAGQKVTVDEASSTTNQKGTSSASSTVL
jgi:acyl-CoA synthetase (AMP-forming)/AMP-acid ligase II